MSSESSQLAVLLASAADSGVDDGYALVIQRVVDRLVVLARRMLRAYPHLQRWEQTDDVVQEVAIRLCRSLQEIKPRSADELFGLAILQIRRTLIDLARHHFGPLGQATHHRSNAYLRDVAYAKDASLVALDRSGEPQTLCQWAEFHEAVGRLPPAERDVFQYVWYGDASYADVANLLGVARRTVIRRMNAARLRLETAMVAGVE